EFWEDGFSSVITFCSIAPREGLRRRLTPSGRCWNRGRSPIGWTAGYCTHASTGPSLAASTWRWAACQSGPLRTRRAAANDLADLVRKGPLEATGGRGRRSAYRLRHE